MNRQEVYVKVPSRPDIERFIAPEKTVGGLRQYLLHQTRNHDDSSAACAEKAEAAVTHIGRRGKEASPLLRFSP